MYMSGSLSGECEAGKDILLPVLSQVATLRFTYHTTLHLSLGGLDNLWFKDRIG